MTKCVRPVILSCVFLTRMFIEAPERTTAAGSDSEQETLPVNLGSRAAGEDWPCFLGPTHNSRSSETGIRTDWSTDGLPIVWQRTTGTGYAAGAISRGRYYHFERAGDHAQLVCLHAERGTELWTFQYPTQYVDLNNYDNGPRCSPVVDGNRVYIFGADGMLCCLRADDGTLIWQCDTTQKFGVVQKYFGVGSTPVVEGDLLIAIVGGSPPGSQKLPPQEVDRVEGNGSGIVAFDKFTGDVKYTLTNELASYASPVVATVRDRRRCFALCRGGMVVFFPEDGALNFRVWYPCVSYQAVNASTPVIVGNEVFVSEAYGPGSCMFSVEPAGYQIQWRDNRNSRSKSMQTHFNTAVYYHGYLYGCSGRYPRNAELRCVEWKTGRIMWAEPTHIRSSFLYVDEHLVNLEERGKLRLIKATPKRFELISECTLGESHAGPLDADDVDEQAFVRSGVPHASAVESQPSLKPPCWAAPTLSHGLLYVRSANQLICLELIPPSS